eukprot:c38785_g1_i1.p1 GENE.c38785_g1_i1~~c38785_g1_i1.p1  ORF type:complete len:390 (+),score=67.61 c38785_g1_i1:6-1175(+)
MGNTTLPMRAVNVLGTVAVLLAVLTASTLAYTAAEKARVAENIAVSFPRLSAEERASLLEIVLTHPRDPAPKKVPIAAVPPCPALSPRPSPMNVSSLGPVDVAVVAALGDSISMGSNALSTNWLNLKRYPGISWSIGGDSGASTMANMLKQFSPKVWGGSVGSGDSATLNGNFAVAGAVSEDVPGQAASLVAGLKARANYTSEWKVITILIGGNDLCAVCNDKTKYSAANYEANLDATLQTLTAIPRVLISLTSALDYPQLHQFMGPFCAAALKVVCPCSSSSDEATRAYVSSVIVQYNAVLPRLAAKYNGIDGRDDFAVVVQPFMTNTDIPSASYLSTADCFHPSGSGQALIATGLWNNMLQPVSSKATSVAPSATFTCPTKSSVFGS